MTLFATRTMALAIAKPKGISFSAPPSFTPERKLKGLCLDSHVFRFGFPLQLNAVKFRLDKKRKVSTGSRHFTSLKPSPADRRKRANAYL